MADYYTPTVIQQTKSDADMTPLELLLLSHIFDAERDGDSWHLFSEQGPADMLYIERAALEAALAASERACWRQQRQQLCQRAPARPASDRTAAVASRPRSQHDVLGAQHTEHRETSSTLACVTAVSSYTCSRMRPDGFGGAAVLISADKFMGKSTNDLLEEFIEEITP
ncbi:hypothetical protein [Pseudorhodoplanes sp.]|uniref:hypothetical protein n=1 Tax=Pseudorhodoplanes sp. TaxID=1934341 RepID=UPI003D0A5D8F